SSACSARTGAPAPTGATPCATGGTARTRTVRTAGIEATSSSNTSTAWTADPAAGPHAGPRAPTPPRPRRRHDRYRPAPIRSPGPRPIPLPRPGWHRSSGPATSRAGDPETRADRSDLRPSAPADHASPPPALHLTAGTAGGRLHRHGRAAAARPRNLAPDGTCTADRLR